MKVHLVVDKTNHANRTHGKALDGKMEVKKLDECNFYLFPQAPL